MSDDKPDLETRVKQFGMMKLPGQPMGMHMGTLYLVNDLWREVKRLRDKSEEDRLNNKMKEDLNESTHEL